MRIRSLRRCSTACGWSLLALLLATRAAGAQASTHVGMRVGYNLETNEALLSANLMVPMTNRIYFYPSLDVYTPDRGNRVGFNGDVKFSFPMASGPALYLGAGLGVINRNVGDFSNSDVGANLLAGFESRAGWIHPFVEGKVMLYDRSQLQLIGGVNLTLGSRY